MGRYRCVWCVLVVVERGRIKFISATRSKKNEHHATRSSNHTPTTTPTPTNHRRLTFSFTRMGFFQPFIASKHNAMLFQITDGTCHYFFSSFTVAMAFFQLCCCNPNLQFRWQFFSGIVKDLFGSTKEKKKEESSKILNIK